MLERELDEMLGEADSGADVTINLETVSRRNLRLFSTFTNTRLQPGSDTSASTTVSSAGGDDDWMMWVTGEC